MLLRSARASFAGLLLVIGSACPALGQSSQMAQMEKATFDLQFVHAAYAPGAQAELTARVTIEPGWHVNSQTPTFDYLIPTELTLELPSGWSDPEIQYPAGELRTFAFEEEALSVYEGEFTITALIAVPDTDGLSDVIAIPALLRYQACDDRSCLPPVTAEETATIVIDADGQESAAPGKLPPLALMVFLGLIGGLILNAMPCVLPVLSLKVFGLVRSAAESRSAVVKGALATAAGILCSFWGLAIAAIIARFAGGAVGWGIQFQEPTFVVFLALVVLLFTLNLWGVFEVPLPGRLARIADSTGRSGHSGQAGREGVASHFATGLFATLMATPCSAPYLGPAMGFALSQSSSVILAIFTAVGLGMSLPYLALAAAPSSVRLLPKPGPWMNQFKVTMGFLLAGAVVWLLYVLAGQISAERVAAIQIGLLALALFLWLRQSHAGRAFRKVATLLVLATVGFCLYLAYSANSGAHQARAWQAQSLIPWQQFDRPLAEQLADQGQLVFVDVTADWCFTCKVNEKLVLETEEVAGAFDRFNVIPMKADWTTRDPGIARFLADHGRYGIPFYLLYRPATEPHLFAELLTQDNLVSVIEEAATRQTVVSEL